jgi:hypothetical protein
MDLSRLNSVSKIPSDDTMRRYIRAILLITILMPRFDVASQGQDDKAKKAPGSDFQHPIYLPIEEGKTFAVKDVGDYSLRRDIVYILRLEAGEHLSATISSAFVMGQYPSTTTLALVDGRTKSLEDTDAKVLDRQLSAIDRTQKPSVIKASIAYTAPVTADYYLIADFQGGGVEFKLTINSEASVATKRPLTCVTGQVATAPTYLSPGSADSLISDVTVGERAKASHPDEHNRQFCLTSTCKTRPPTSLVLTFKLTDGFATKKELRACWDVSNTITEVAFLH